ncbi:MAG: hypothetical protein QW666_01680 [Candidatus Woesearchaeota archaeon]
MKTSLKILASKERRHFISLINKQWGCEFKPDYAFLLSEKEKIYAINPDISKINLSLFRISSVGMYFAELKRGELRLSIEGSQIIGPLATKNVAELNDKEAIDWLRGKDLNKQGEWSGFVIIKHNDDFLGTGKYAVDGRILNFVPKSRRLNVAELP